PEQIKQNDHLTTAPLPQFTPNTPAFPQSQHTMSKQIFHHTVNSRHTLKYSHRPFECKSINGTAGMQLMQTTTKQPNHNTTTNQTQHHPKTPQNPTHKTTKKPQHKHNKHPKRQKPPAAAHRHQQTQNQTTAHNQPAPKDNNQVKTKTTHHPPPRPP
ncbi:hypothetical protein ACTHS6_10965, partial [Neisseria sp. P0016.S006]